MSKYRITRRWLLIAAISTFLPRFEVQAEPDREDHSHFDDEHEIEAYREAIEEGTQRFEHGDFTGARRAFQRAYAMFPRAEVMFNIASTHRREGNAQRALEAYQQVLTSKDVDPERRRLSEHACDELRAELSVDDEVDKGSEQVEAAETEKQKQKQKPRPNERKGPLIDAPPPVERPRRAEAGSDKGAWTSASGGEEQEFPWYRDRLGATLVSAGLMSLVTGSYLMLDAQSLAREASEASSHGAFIEELNTARDSRRLGGILAAAGGVAALVGGYRILRAEPDRNQVSVVSDGQSVEIGYAGQF